MDDCSKVNCVTCDRIAYNFEDFCVHRWSDIVGIVACKYCASAFDSLCYQDEKYTDLKRKQEQINEQIRLREEEIFKISKKEIKKLSKQYENKEKEEWGKL